MGGKQQLRDDDPLCEWDGPLLPLEPQDYDEMIDHGTDKGYQQHYRFKVPTCGPCREAHKIDRQNYRARKKAQSDRLQK